MSGFDSYDSAEGDMDYFDGDEMSYFDNDEMSYASGAPNASSPVSDPYVLQYVNTTTADVTAYIFGYNLWNGVTNWNNPAAVVITNLQNTTVGYSGLVNQSNNKPFKIGKFRFQSSTAAQLQQTLSINHIDANGKTYQTPLNLSIMLDAYQQQGSVLDVTKPITVDGNTYISFTLKGSATFVISMFPVTVISAKAQLNGGKTLNSARAPRLSAKNVAPVIIQTSSDVKGINRG
jgi:hypothetical protein